MATINTSRFKSEELDDFIELAEIGGYDIIRLVSTKPRSVLKINSGFEILKKPNKVSKQSFGGFAPIKVRGAVRFLPDSSGFCMGFIIDTPFNRIQLAHQLRHNVFKPMSEKVVQEITDLALENGISVAPYRQSSRFVKRSVVEERLDRQLANNEAEILELKLKLERAERQALELEKKADHQQDIKADKQERLTNPTVPSVEIDEEGEPVAVEVPAEVKPAPRKRAKPMKRKTVKK